MSDTKTITTSLQSPQTDYDVVIIGAGINGAGVFRDAVHQGFKTLLIDQADFCTQTSAKSSKMLHGGIRYLQYFDFALVQEALEEKNYWIQKLPQHCYSANFLLPVYEHGPFWPIEIKLGMFLYGILGHNLITKNNFPHYISAPEVLHHVPLLKQAGLCGSGLYEDGIMDDRAIALFCINETLTRHPHLAMACRYQQLVSVDEKNDIFHLQIKNTPDQAIRQVSGKHLIFCTGPFTDQLMPRLNIPWSPKLALSKGSHLWLSKSALPLNHCVVLQDKDGRVIFLNPHKDKILLGTTEEPLAPQEDLAHPMITRAEREYLLENLLNYFPNLNLKNEHIIGDFAGYRPLVRIATLTAQQNEQNLGKVGRHHSIFRPWPRCQVLLGGKYTTFRKMAMEVVKNICQMQDCRYQQFL